jgi:MFS family permease
LIPTPIAVLSMMGLALTPVLGAWLHEALGTYAPNRFVLNLAIFSFFWTTFEIATIIANTIFGGLINDVVPQEVIGRFFGMFRAVSLLAGILFNYCLMGHAEEHFVAIFLGIGLLYGVGFALMCCKVKEGSYPPPEVAAERGVHPLLEIQAYLRECFSNPYYVWVFVGMTFATLASGPFNSFCLFYVKSIGMDLDAYGKYIALTYVISLVLSYPMGMLADRFHPLRMGMLATGLYSVAMIAGWCFARSVGSFAVALVLHGVLSGMFFTCTASLGQRLFPRAKFAQFASANGIIGALAFLVMPPLVGALLDFTGHAYRYTFVIGGVLALVGLASLTVVYYKFMRLGGPRGYVAPEPAVKPDSGSNRLDI